VAKARGWMPCIDQSTFSILVKPSIWEWGCSGIDEGAAAASARVEREAGRLGSGGQAILTEELNNRLQHCSWHWL
jgi:hypothetical protein